MIINIDPSRGVKKYGVYVYMECTSKGCKYPPFGGRDICMKHQRIDTDLKIKLLAEGKITKEEIMKDATPGPKTMQEHMDLIKEYHEEVKRRKLPPIK
jgi:hypothetical protein